MPAILAADSRLDELLAYDAQTLAGHPRAAWLAGIDEVGRGSCMGPVTAAAVLVRRGDWQLDACLARAPQLATLDDSKRLTFAQRDMLAAILRKHLLWGLGEASLTEIAELNIAQASLLASARALEAALDQAQAPHEATFVVIDGRMRLPQWPREAQAPVIKGDARSFVIAAASVIAKQARDAWAIRVAQQYPVYGWERNMGYPTPEHKSALARYGPSPLHRMGYRPVRDALANTSR